MCESRLSDYMPLPPPRKAVCDCPRETLAGRTPGSASASGQLEYVWLCSSCTVYLTIQPDEEFGTRVVRKFEVKNGSELATPAKDRNKMDIA